MKRVLLVCVLGVSIAACDSKSSSPTSPSTSTPTPPISSSPTLRSMTLSVNEDAMKSRGTPRKQPRLHCLLGWNLAECHGDVLKLAVGQR